MDDMRWMIAEQTLHEELMMERSVRSIYNTEDNESFWVKPLAALLIWTLSLLAWNKDATPVHRSSELASLERDNGSFRCR